MYHFKFAEKCTLDGMSVVYFSTQPIEKMPIFLRYDRNLINRFIFKEYSTFTELTDLVMCVQSSEINPNMLIFDGVDNMVLDQKNYRQFENIHAMLISLIHCCTKCISEKTKMNCFSVLQLPSNESKKHYRRLFPILKDLYCTKDNFIECNTDTNSECIILKLIKYFSNYENRNDGLLGIQI